MRCRSEELHDNVFFFRIEVNDTDSAAALFAVLVRIRALDVAALGKDQHAFFVCDKVFY